MLLSTAFGVRELVTGREGGNAENAGAIFSAPAFLCEKSKSGGKPPHSKMDVLIETGVGPCFTPRAAWEKSLREARSELDAPAAVFLGDHVQRIEGADDGTVRAIPRELSIHMGLVGRKVNDRAARPRAMVPAELLEALARGCHSSLRLRTGGISTRASVRWPIGSVGSDTCVPRRRVAGIEGGHECVQHRHHFALRLLCVEGR